MLIGTLVFAFIVGYLLAGIVQWIMVKIQASQLIFESEQALAYISRSN